MSTACPNCPMEVDDLAAHERVCSKSKTTLARLVVEVDNLRRAQTTACEDAADFHDELGALAKRVEALERDSADKSTFYVPMSRAPAADPSKGDPVEIPPEGVVIFHSKPLGSEPLEKLPCTPSPAALPERPEDLEAPWLERHFTCDSPNLADERRDNAAHAEQIRLYALSLERRLAEVEKERSKCVLALEGAWANGKNLASARDALAAKLAECERERDGACAAHVEAQHRANVAVRGNKELSAQLSAVKAASETWEPTKDLLDHAVRHAEVGRRAIQDALRAAATGEKNPTELSKGPVDAVEDPQRGKQPTQEPVAGPHLSPPRPAFALSRTQREELWKLVETMPSGQRRGATEAWIERLVSEEVARAGSGMVKS